MYSKREFNPKTVKLITPKLNEYLDAGIFEPAISDKTRDMSNMNAVSKPTSEDFLFGKAIRELRKVKGTTLNKDRLVSIRLQRIEQ